MSVPGDFTVEVGELDDLVRDLEACERDLTLLTDDLDRRMVQLHGTWHGLAAAAQHAAHQEWSQGMVAMHEALSSLRRAARLAHGHYGAAATTNVDMWQQVCG